MQPPRASPGSWFFAAVLVAASVPLGAQESRPLLAPAEFAIDQWTTEDGIPQNSVNAIVQAPDGYLWVGTFGGLARFDGTSFTLMERTDSAGRHVDRVLALAVGPDSSLWIGTENGLLRRNNGLFHAYPALDGVARAEILALHADGEGTLWIGTSRGGLGWFADGAFGMIHEVGGVAIGPVTSIVEGTERTIWVNTHAGRLLALPRGDPAAGEWRRQPGREPAHLLLQDEAGARWFAQPHGTTGVWGLSDSEIRMTSVPSGSTMIEDAGGGYWVGTVNDGLFSFRIDADSAVVRRYPLPDGRLGYRVRSSYRDAEGSVWVGTDANGLLRARRNLFTTYSSEHGLSHDVATAIFADRDGTVWVGTNCGGVNAIAPDRRTLRVFNPRQSGDSAGDPCVFALTADPDGTMWQGTYGGGLTPLATAGEPQRGRMAGLPDSVFLALMTDRSGSIWAGSRTDGLLEIRDGRVHRAFTTDHGLAHNSIRTIHQTRDGAIWIGTAEGLSRLDQDGFTTYSARDGLSSSHVRSLHEDEDGTLWVGTYGGGLHRLRDGEFIPITRHDGLADDVVSAILEDDAGNLWMSGNRGVHRVAREQLNAFADGRIDRVHSVVYGRADGLPNPETNGGFHPAAWKDARGHLWFPTLEGVAVVDPTMALPQGAGPAATLEAVVVDGVSHPPDSVITVGPGRANLEFRYAGLSLSPPQHSVFRYRLDGFDRDWVDAGTRRVAYYPGLPAGSYQFRVRAANRDGVWGETDATFRFRVIAPFWTTWWFRLAVAAALLGLLGGIVRRREASARQERAAKENFSRALIESQEQERKRLAGELHDGLGQELLIVRNRILLMLRGDGVDGAVQERLRQVNNVVTSSLASLREMAHNLTPHQLQHLGLSSALETMADAVAETSGIDLKITIEPIDGLLPVPAEINLFRIVQEGLTNVVRHSGALTAELHVRRDGPVVRVTLMDSGRGFRMKRDSGGRLLAGFGLTGMAERARILDGTLDVHSAPGYGTHMELTVPVTPQEPTPSLEGAAAATAS